MRDSLREQIQQLKLKKKITTSRQKIESLKKSKFYTEAFLDSYILSEYISRRLIHALKADKNSQDLSKNVLEILSQYLTRISTEIRENLDVSDGKDSDVHILVSRHNLDTRIRNKISAHFRNDSSEEKIINIMDLLKVFDELGIEYEKLNVKIIMKSTIEKSDLPEEQSDSQESIFSGATARARRHTVVHSASILNQKDYEKYERYFDYFFDLVLSIYEP